MAGGGPVEKTGIMQTHDELLEKFTEGYAKYGTRMALLVTDLTENKQLLPKEIMYKLFHGPRDHQLYALGQTSDDCGKLTDYKTRSGCSDEAEQAFNCWLDLAKKGGAWVFSNGIVSIKPAPLPQTLWSVFVHHTLLGKTAEQVDNVWKYCPFAASV